MKKTYWVSNSDEYRYLDEIDSVIEQAKGVIRVLLDIKKAECWNIQCNEEKDMVDFTDVKSNV